MKRFKLATFLCMAITVTLCVFSLVACDFSFSGHSSDSNKQEPNKIYLSSIDITHLPNKIDYLEGEDFDATGMVVTAVYSNGTSAVVTNYRYIPTGPLSENDDKITVFYSEGDIEKTACVNITVGEPAEESERTAALEAVGKAFDKLDIDEYSESRFNSLIETLNESVRGIRNATTVQGIEKYKNDAISAFENAVTRDKVLDDTIINTYSGKYEFDKDENGNLLIQYGGYPGAWTYVGNKSLSVDTKKENVLVFKVRNNSDQNIKVMLKLSDGGEYEVGTSVVQLSGLETKEFRVNFSYAVSKLYFFVDSCENTPHERSGEVAILDAHFEFDRSLVVDTELYQDKTVTFNQAISTEVAAEYTLTEADHAFFVDRIDVIGKVNFNGNGDSMKYFGISGVAGNNKISLSDGKIHASSITDGNAFCFTIPVDETSKLVTGSKISTSLAYNAEGLTFEITKFVIHYTKWEAVSIETLTFEGSEGVIYNNDAATTTFEVPYSSFNNKGRLLKADFEFETTNFETYTKTQIYVQGLTFNGGIGNNVLNISAIMEQSDGSTPKTTTGKVTVYPTDDKTILASSGSISIDCWWASASYVKIKSITLYTVSMEEAEPVENLVARSLDKAVYLSWDKELNATEYLVYVDGNQVATTTKTYCMVSGLENGTEYTFTVKAQNSVGTAEGVSVVGTPAEGENFDAFIDAIDNTSALEKLIGEEKLMALYDDCARFDGNNYRLLTALEKMKNGESQTICYVGGSITVGENATYKDSNGHQQGYAYYSYQWLKDNYDSAGNSKFINASISGTGSEIGIVRAQKDIYDHQPNIIFIEFGANNSSIDFYRNTYEGLIRNCLNLPSKPAVVVVISCTTYTHNSQAVKYMYEIAEYYGLPTFSIDDGLYSLCEGNISTSNQYFEAFISDGVHPNNEGHALYGKCLASFLRRQTERDKDEQPVVKTAPLYSSDYDNFVSIDNTNASTIVKDMGSFVADNTATVCTSQQSDVTAFQQGFKKTTTTENKAMVIEVNCKNFIIIVCNSNPASHGSDYVFGTLSVKITNLNTMNVETQTIEIGPKGWDNPVALSLFEESESSDYRIEISFTETTGVGNIFAMGYTA